MDVVRTESPQSGPVFVADAVVEGQQESDNEGPSAGGEPDDKIRVCGGAAPDQDRGDGDGEGEAGEEEDVLSGPGAGLCRRGGFLRLHVGVLRRVRAAVRIP